MSVSVYWSPLATTKLLDGAMSSEVAALTKVFGDMPVTLHNDQTTLDKLTAMSATYQGKTNPYEQLLEALIEWDVVQISTMY